jgi:hypothetical protein
MNGDSALSEQVQTEIKQWQALCHKANGKELIGNSQIAQALKKKLNAQNSQKSIEETYAEEIEAIKTMFLYGIGCGRVTIQEYKDDIQELSSGNSVLPAQSTTRAWDKIIAQIQSIEHGHAIIQAMLIEHFINGAYLGAALKYPTVVFSRTITTPTGEFQTTIKTTAGVSADILEKVAKIDEEKNTQLEQWFNNYATEFKGIFEPSLFQKFKSKLGL